MLRVGNILVMVLGCLCAIPTWSEQETCQQRTIIVSIGTRDGTPVPDLNKTSLQGTYRKKPIRIASTVFNQDPPRVVLLLDISGSMNSMTSNFDRNLSADLAEDLISSLPPASEIGLGFFYKQFIPISPPISDRARLQYQLESLRSHPTAFGGKTALWTAILKGVKMFDHPRLGDAIYVITDGGDNASETTMNHVVQTLREFDIRLFAFVFQRMAGSPEEESGPGSLLEAVEDTGGITVSVHDDIRGAFSGIHGNAGLYKSGKITDFGSLLGSQYGQISNFYRVDIDLPETVNKPLELKLDVAGFGKSQREKLLLRYPHKFVPCP